MSWPSVKFMAAPDLTAATRLDLSAGDVRIAQDGGFQQGVPTFAGAPESWGVEYGYREDLEFTVNITGTKAAAAAVLQKLAFEQLRRENWLLFQLQPGSPPVWFHTWRREPGDLSLEHVYDETTGSRLPDLWKVRVPLTADSFIYGARETLPAVTINNDPAAATNPCFYALPTIKGDAPAPLRIAADFSATLDQSDIFWSVTPVPSTYNAPIVWPIGTGDGLTVGADTGAAIADATFSGGSYRSTSFTTTPGMATRLSGTAPAVVPPGRYMVFLRASRVQDAGAGSRLAFRFGYTDLAGVDIAGSPTVVMDRGPSTSQVHTAWVPLGTFSFPRYSNDLQVPGFDFAPTWALQVQRLSGPAAVRLDAIILVPVELRGIGDSARSLSSSFNAFGPQASDLAAYWDGDLEAFTRVNGVGVADTGIQPSALRGGFPHVFPGQKNVAHLLQQTRLYTGFFGTTDNSDSISNSASVTFSYHPRYLYLRGD